MVSGINLNVLDDQLTASSQYGQSYAPKNARINSAKSWCAATGDYDPLPNEPTFYIQAS